MSKQEPVKIKVSDLARICLATELASLRQFQNDRATPELLLEIADRIMRRPDGTLERAWHEDAWALALRIFRTIQPGLLALCDEAAQHALETPNHYLATKVREKLIGRVFIDNSPRPARLRR